MSRLILIRRCLIILLDKAVLRRIYFSVSFQNTRLFEECCGERVSGHWEIPPKTKTTDEASWRMEWHYDGHTNTLVPLSAKGDAARMFSRYADGNDPVRGPYVDNSDLANVLFWAMDPS
jgi:hypothetical protein